MTEKDTDLVLTSEQAGLMLGMSRDNVTKLAKRGRLRGEQRRREAKSGVQIMQWWFSSADVEAYKRANPRKSAPSLHVDSRGNVWRRRANGKYSIRDTSPGVASYGVVKDL